MIERIAIERGHEIVLIVDENNRAACTDEQLKQAVFVYFAIGMPDFYAVPTIGVKKRFGLRQSFCQPF